MNCYLVLRFRSLGNVAMSVPLLSSLAQGYASAHFVVATEKDLSALYYGLDNVQVYTLKRKDGLDVLMLCRQLKKRYGTVEIVDLQGNASSRSICRLAQLMGVRNVVIDNERWKKLRLCVRGYCRSRALTKEIERYRQTFCRAGLESDICFETLPVNKEAQRCVEDKYGKKQGFRIGIAPFAKRRTNRLPYSVMREVIWHYAQQEGTHVYLFGAGRVETEMLQQWASIFPNTSSVAGQLSLGEELELMRTLDSMLCMDSANQHLAALVKLPVLSVWCGTHPYAGYGAYRQSEEHIMQRKLSCRPCTVNGREQCRYRNFLCKEFRAEEIAARIDDLISPFSTGEEDRDE